MTSMELLELLGSVRDKYVMEAHEETAIPRRHTAIKRPLLVAAMIALMLLLVGCAVAYTQGWFVDFFAHQPGAPLSSEQITYIEEKEQVIAQVQTHGGWTVELKSAMNDGRSAYLILGVTGPEGVDLAHIGANQYLLGEEFVDPVRNNRNIEIFSIRHGWEEDNDGLPHTRDYTIRWEPEEGSSISEPFGPDVEWTVYFENILHKTENMEYLQELLNGKYKGQDDILFTGEESQKLYSEAIVAEGPWEFTFTFASQDSGIELLTDPVTVSARASRTADDGAPHESPYEDVTITSFVLNSLSATIRHTADALVTFSGPESNDVTVVMGDGSRIPLEDRSAGRSETVLDANIPIVLSEVDHILMPDGTIIPVP